MILRSVVCVGISTGIIRCLVAVQYPFGTLSARQVVGIYRRLLGKIIRYGLRFGSSNFELITHLTDGYPIRPLLALWIVVVKVHASDDITSNKVAALV